MNKMLPLLLLSAALMLFSSFIPEDSVSGYKPGDIVRDFSLKNVDGKMMSLAGLKDNKGVILVFTCNHCPYSVAYEDRIIQLHEQYAPRGYPVVAVNPNDAVAYPADSYENMQERAADKKFPFAYLHDETQAIAKAYGATRTPHVYLLTREKDQYRVAYVGAIDDNSNEPELVKVKYLETALGELMGGLQVSVPQTKAIGCSIKWKK